MDRTATVFITGASTGIGRTCALYLDKRGFHVFAGVRKIVDGDALVKASSDRLRAITIDVTDCASIQAAVCEVSHATNNQLSGLINNAGVALGGPLEILPVKDIQQLLEVNVMGVLAVTKAFLPLLRQSRGRIINMGSSSGLLALPCLSTYAASKFALEAITDSLRVELRPFGITVSIIEAGNVETPIWGKGVAATNQIANDTRPETLRLYKPLIDFSKRIALNSPKLPAEKVAKVIGRILRTPKPKGHYIIGADARFFRLARHVPCLIRDWVILKIIPGYGYQN